MIIKPCSKNLFYFQLKFYSEPGYIRINSYCGRGEMIIIKEFLQKF